MSYLADTSCLVALLCGWHEHHSITVKEMNRRHQSGDELILSAYSLMESYAVLTRIPFPFRLSERDAHQLLKTNFSGTTLITLTKAQYWDALRLCSDLDISGGQVYDALIVACAKKAGAKTLLTWNQKHFIEFQDSGLSVQAPR
jgi:predicted nucleic acid-binding protein